MSERELEPTVRQSVLDRLLDAEPRLAGDRPISWSESVARMRDSVKRDLEWLLNTRRIPEPASDDFPEVQQSVYHFGIPDMSSMSRDWSETPEILRRQIEECIRLFEPRLTAVQVQTRDTSDPHQRLHFAVHGLLDIEPNPERVMFDTVLEVGSGEFSVTGD
ncbi:MAG: type VI secretion system baseplate subunit TssE [Gemmatimonadota bacterium]|jgi:type VI secretion system protein ImpF